MRDHAGVELRLLGGASLRVGGAVHALEAKAAALLCMLAVDGAAARATVAALLWPDVDAADGRRNLRQRVFQLHRLAGRELVCGRQTLRLVEGIGTDAAMPAACESSGGAPAHAEADGGELLAGFEYGALADFSAWLAAARRRRLDALIDAWSAAASAHEAAGEYAAAIVLTQRIVAADGLLEHSHRRLMRVHYLRGDRAAALAAFDRCEQLLKHELGARPGPETLQLLDQIERAEVTPSRVVRRVPPAVLRPPVLIGRSAEWQALHEAWEAGTSVAVTGQAGLGKTRLLSDFARAVGDDGRRVLMVSSRPGDERLPHAVLSRLLRAVLAERSVELAPGVCQELASLLPELGESSPETRRDETRFVNAVSSLIDDAIAAGLDAVLLDDLQFADEASLDVARHIAAQGRLRWIVAFRDVELGPAAAGLLATLAQSTQQRTLVLAPLGHAEVHALIASLSVPELDADTWSEVMFRRTGGNPLFLLETIKSFLTRDAGPTAALASLPLAPNVGTLIERRITQLSAGAVRIARCAAVAGQDFSAALASHVLVSEPLDLVDDWSELESAQVLRDGAFAHDLIHEAALASVPKSIALELHAKIARFLADGGAASARIAPHAEAGALWALAAGCWQQAGEHAERAGRLLEAGRFFGSAGRNHELSGDRERAFASYRDEVDAIVVHGYDAPAEALLDRLTALAVTPAQRVVALQVRAYQFDRWGEWERAAAMCREALGLVDTAREPEVHLRLACTLASSYCALDRAEEAVAVLRPCELWARAHGNASDRMHYAGLLGQSLDSIGRPSEALDSYAVALEIARAEKRPEDVAMLQGVMGTSHHAMGNTVRALEVACQSAAMLGETQGGLRSLSLLQIEFTVAKYQTDLGLYAEAVATLERIGPEFSRQGATARRQNGDLLLALVFVHLGQFARATQLLAQLGPIATSKSNLASLGIRVELAHAQGASLSALARQFRLHAERGSEAVLHTINVWRCRLPTAREAVPLLSSTLSWATRHSRHGLALGARVRLAEFARRAGDFEGATAHASAALTLGKNHHAWMQYRGDLYLEAALAFDAAGDTGAARHAVEAGIDWLRVTLTQVPPPFRASFLERNPSNRELIACGRRIGGVVGWL